MITARPISHANPEGPKVEMRVSRRAYMILRTGMFVVLAAAAVLVFVMQLRLSAMHELPSPAFQTVKKYTTGKPGPWGDIQSLRINIERPDELIPLTPEFMPAMRWYFDGVSSEQVARLFKQTGVSENVSTFMLNPARCEVVPGRVVITPGDRAIVELSPKDRSAIYYLLSLSSQNSAHWMPFAFSEEVLDELLEQSKLQPETQSLVRHLLYQRGKSVCFSDLDTVLRLIRVDTERRRLVKAMSRQTSLLVKLRVTSATDINQLIAYWGGEGRTKDLRPLLESLATSSSGTTIDVAHLLPAMARKLLYTYPFPASGNAAAQNCFWTAFNFFNRQPNDAFAETSEVEKVLRTDYRPVEGAPAFGDVVLLSCAELGLVHAAVYVADDIVFTKNGGSFSKPWVLMKLDELITSYPLPCTPKVTLVRRKPAET